MNKKIEESHRKLQAYLESSPLGDRYKGADPFDGLNNQIFQSSLLSNYRFSRLAWLQFNKKSPVNFRTLVKTESGYNAQAVGLFISSYCKLFQIDRKQEYKEIITFLTEKLMGMISQGYSGTCWGYNFDWQARAFFQPKFTPMIVPTSFAVNGLLDAYDLFKNEKLLDVAVSSADFVLNDLNRTHEGDVFAFSYSPLDSTVVYNATLLASQLLSRVYKFTGKEKLKYEAGKSVEFCLKHQNGNGSWTYGTKSYHQWIDNFHSGYNLVCLNDYFRYTEYQEQTESLEKGMNFYLNTFFESSGRPGYYSDRTFPIDINNPAQLVITLSKLKLINKNLPLLERVLLWTIENMQDTSGYFYYQIHRFYKIKIPYMRWSQAWMFYALSTYLVHMNEKE